MSLSPSRPFILRPVATSLLMAAILLAGFVGYQQLPVSALPEVDYPIIQVLTFYPGAGPEVMASSVTAPLERQFGQMPGLKQMTSVSSGGGSVITLEFNLDENIDVAEQEVQAAINAGNSFLPTDLPNPPIYSKVNPADAPIMTLALTSNSLPLDKIEDAADTNLAQKISQVTGVGMVSIAGGQKPSVRIQANPAQLAAYNLSLEDLRTALAAANVDQAKGTLNGKRQSYTIGANDQLLSSGDYKPVIVAYRNGAAVRASDVATIVDAAENSQQAAWMDRQPAVIVNIQRQPGANIIAVVDRIKTLLPQLQTSLPASVQVKVLTDRTITIRASVRGRGIRADAHRRAGGDGDLPLPAQPGGDDHSLGRGAAVDRRHLRRDVPAGLLAEQPDADGADHFDGLRGGRRHRDDREYLALHRRRVEPDAGGAQGQRADRLHHHVADGLADRGADSAALHERRGGPALPRVRHHAGGHHSGFGRGLADADADDVLAHSAGQDGRQADPLLPLVGEMSSTRIIAFYGRTLQVVLRYRFITLMVTIATFVATLLLYIVVPKGFFPVQDTGVILGISEAPQTVSFTSMAERQQKLVDVLLQDPAVDNISSFIGVDGTNTTLNSGRIQITLKPLDVRKISAT